jgi:aminopeptidase N
MEKASGRDLQWFFRQWLTRPGTPRIDGSWRFDAARKQVDVELEQSGSGDSYRLPLEIGIVMKAGDLPRIERFELKERRATFSIAAEAEPAAVVLDPNTWLLMEAGPFTRKQ